MKSGNLYDLKLGYTCNNNCYTCVVKPDYKEWKERGIPLDVSYGKLIQLMNTQEFLDAEIVVLTGGEPTIRKEFLRIVRYINDKFPEKRINLQTNGRKLKDFIKIFYEEHINMNYVVAIHGTEEIHNKFVDAPIHSNPYREVLSAIEEIQDVYGDFNSVARTETVLSSLNYKNVLDLVIYLYSKGIKHMGISYPHLDGYMREDPEIVREKSIPFSMLTELFYNLYKLCKKYRDLQVYFEQVPVCMWRDTKGNLLDLPDNLLSMSHKSYESIAVKFPNRELDDNFIHTLKHGLKLSDVCKECVFCCSCNGTWSEAVDVFGSDGFIPITRKEQGVVANCAYLK